jgi:hypothetical protein
LTPSHTAVIDTAPDGTLPQPPRPFEPREGGSNRMTVEVARRTRRRATTPKTPIATDDPAQTDSSAPASAAARTAGLTPSSTYSPSRHLPSAPGSSMSIGEINQTVFDCPKCARPLALGARRCPGCSTRLVNGVALGKASLFVAVGLTVGLISGAVAGTVLGLTQNGGAAPAPIAIIASAAPTTDVTGSSAPATAAPTAVHTSPPSNPDIPPIARSALGQMVGMSDRLRTGQASLAAILAAKPFDAMAAAQVLRSMSADSVYAEQLAASVSAWSANPIGAKLASFYGAVHDTASDGLVASVRNEAAYRASASAMVKLIDGVDELDSSIRSAAAAAGIQLPEPTAAP